MKITQELLNQFAEGQAQLLDGGNDFYQGKIESIKVAGNTLQILFIWILTLDDATGEWKEFPGEKSYNTASLDTFVVRPGHSERALSIVSSVCEQVLTFFSKEHAGCLPAPEKSGA